MAKMTLESIQKQIEKLQAQAKKLEGFQNAKKSKSLAQVRALMNKLGVSIEDLGTEVQKPVQPPKSRGRPAVEVSKSKPAVKNRKPVAPKYRDPNTGETWTGRGKPPRWLAEQIHMGHSKDEFLIVIGSSSSTDHAPTEKPSADADVHSNDPVHPEQATSGHVEGDLPGAATVSTSALTSQPTAWTP